MKIGKKCYVITRVVKSKVSNTDPFESILDAFISSGFLKKSPEDVVETTLKTEIGQVISFDEETVCLLMCRRGGVPPEIYFTTMANVFETKEEADRIRNITAENIDIDEDDPILFKDLYKDR